MCLPRSLLGTRPGHFLSFSLSTAGPAFSERAPGSSSFHLLRSSLTVRAKDEGKCLQLRHPHRFAKGPAYPVACGVQVSWRETAPGSLHTPLAGVPSLTTGRRRLPLKSARMWALHPSTICSFPKIETACCIRLREGRRSI